MELRNNLVEELISQVRKFLHVKKVTFRILLAVMERDKLNLDLLRWWLYDSILITESSTEFIALGLSCVNPFCICLGVFVPIQIAVESWNHGPPLDRKSVV